jgi:hypothetical protein
MIDLLKEGDEYGFHSLASLLLLMGGLPPGDHTCPCGHCPVQIEEFKVDVHRILIKANGREFELLVNADPAEIREIRASREGWSEKD